jgi:hypothetical protein
MGFFKHLGNKFKRFGRDVGKGFKFIGKHTLSPVLKTVNKGLNFVNKIPVIGQIAQLAETFTPAGEALQAGLALANRVDQAIQHPGQALKQFASPSGLVNLATQLGATKLPGGFVKNALKTSNTFQDALSKAKTVDKVLGSRLGDPYRQLRQNVQSLGKNPLQGGSIQAVKQTAQQLQRDLQARAPDFIKEQAKQYAKGRVDQAVSKLSQQLGRSPFGIDQSQVQGAVSRLGSLLGR